MFRFIAFLALGFLCLTSSSQARVNLVKLAKEVGVIKKSLEHLTERVNGAKVECISKSTNFDHGAEKNIVFLDRQHVYCPPSHFIASFRLQRGGHQGSLVKYDYRCCKFVL
ncbi:uncharacterized protein LOC114949969 [Acropora millepora]|uniref:uncharacterized protein LOC114949969 n=1 Tax=Acropora millepora TaxID=45264 RepID=UPI001CF170FF|nr:uncharacterized protein LOC114949969 [Acropora millepora]